MSCSILYDSVIVVVVVVVATYCCLPLYNIAPGDYTQVTSMTVTFASGITEATVFIPTSTDDIGEDAEMFEAFLFTASAGATIGVDVATVEIIDNTAVVVEFDPVEVRGLESDGTISFTIVRRTQTTETVSVVFSTSPNTAGLQKVIDSMLACSFSIDTNTGVMQHPCNRMDFGYLHVCIIILSRLPPII